MKYCFLRVIIVIVMIAILSGCFTLSEPEPLRDLKFSTVARANTPEFGIREVSRTSPTEFRIMAYIYCERTLTILQRGLHIVEKGGNGDVISEYLLMHPEAINFDSLTDSVYTADYGYRKVYRYQVLAEVPLADQEYSFCIETKYTISETAKYGITCY